MFRNIVLIRHFGSLSISSRGRFVNMGKFSHKMFNFGSSIKNQTSLYIFKSLSSQLPSYKFANLPSLSPTMDKGNIAQWEKNEGDKLEEGDTLCQIETDKAVVAMETPYSGYLAKIIHKAGSKNIPINQPIAIIVKKKEDIDSFNNFEVESISQSKSKEPPSKVNEVIKTEEKIISQETCKKHIQKIDSQLKSDRVFASPYAKKIASELEIDLNSIVGTGPSGRIIAKDINSNNVVPKQQNETNYVDIELTNMRNAIANRLVYSKTHIPHFHVSLDIKMNEISSLRRKIKDVYGDKIKISVNDFIIKAASLALIDIPTCNSQWMDTFIREYKTVDISVAVSTSSGLITPIVFNADKKSLSTINKEVTSLAIKARTNKLIPKEFQGGTFTVSNLGMYGITSFTAIINPPQSCILSVGTIQKKLILNDDGTINVEEYITATLGCDHRVVDGAIGAEWLSKFKGYMETPYSLLI